MKILQIINSLGTGGAEKLLLESIPIYRKQGIQMDILLLWDNNLPFTRALKELNCCQIIILKETANYKSIYNPLSIFRIRKFLKEYDVVHVHLFPAQYFVAFANMLNRKVTPLVFTEHNTENRRLRNKAFKPVERWVYHQYVKVICITKEIKNIYRDYLHRKEESLPVIHNGVNIQHIQSAKSVVRQLIAEEIRADDTLLLQVSAFRQQKDQVTLIRALALLPHQVKLLLVGTGEQKESCRSLAATLGLTERVFFLGQRMDVPQLLKTADIVVLSSRYEGLSLSSIEGMASGKPFVASDVPGLKEIVKGAGVLFPAGNEQRLSEELIQLITDKQYYERIAAQCEARAAQYDISNMVDEHIALYKEVVGEEKDDG